jgi:hypothetical protein
MFRKFDICRISSQKLLHRFKFASKVEIPAHSFAMHVNKMLNCVLQSSQATKNLDVIFVKGEQLRIDAGFFESTWRIHNKLLTYDGAHEMAFCEEDTPDYKDYKHPFAFDHVGLQLWDIMLSQLMASGEHPRVAAEEAWLKSMARARLSQMPRSVMSLETSRRG